MVRVSSTVYGWHGFVWRCLVAGGPLLADDRWLLGAITGWNVSMLRKGQG